MDSVVTAVVRCAGALFRCTPELWVCCPAFGAVTAYLSCSEAGSKSTVRLTPPLTGDPIAFDAPRFHSVIVAFA